VHSSFSKRQSFSLYSCHMQMQMSCKVLSWHWTRTWSLGPDKDWRREAPGRKQRTRLQGSKSPWAHSTGYTASCGNNQFVQQ
jgi:hypothetical protein